ncbi:MAG TPA: hypothetical protein VJC17_04010, partial [Candidatus Dojkabacteria bacterium]|nr:hypothetical protein [Candidatus Dojkabacteria bacterium]
MLKLLVKIFLTLILLILLAGKLNLVSAQTNAQNDLEDISVNKMLQDRRNATDKAIQTGSSQVYIGPSDKISKGWSLLNLAEIIGGCLDTDPTYCQSNQS